MANTDGPATAITVNGSTSMVVKENPPIYADSYKFVNATLSGLREHLTCTQTRTLLHGLQPTM